MAVTSPLIEENVDVSPYNTLNIHARVRHFARVTSVEELQTVLKNHKKSSESICVLGGGSNVLFVDDFDGLLIQVAIPGKRAVKADANYVWVELGAGENWHAAVRWSVQKGWGGIENLSLIPGTVGAAPIQNIGAYGVELEDVFEELTAVEIATGKRQTFGPEACEFGYRDSIFKSNLKGQFVVTQVTLKLSKNPELNTSYGAIRKKLAKKNIENPTIRDISDIIIEIRNSKLPDPAKLANAGSFFKNPIIDSKIYAQLKSTFPSMPGYSVDAHHTKVPAGWLIEQAGWKGKKVGRTGTYRQQALVIVNHGGATGKEILALARKIQQSVLEKFNIELVPEVNIIG